MLAKAKDKKKPAAAAANPQGISARGNALYRIVFIGLLVALVPVALHLFWQVATLDADDPDNPLERFRSNRTAGVLMALACFTVGNA